MIVPNALDLFRKVQLLKRITALYKSNFIMIAINRI